MRSSRPLACRSEARPDRSTPGRPCEDRAGLPTGTSTVADRQPLAPYPRPGRGNPWPCPAAGNLLTAREVRSRAGPHLPEPARKRRRKHRYAGKKKVARPGLEPGTPRFQAPAWVQATDQKDLQTSIIETSHLLSAERRIARSLRAFMQAFGPLDACRGPNEPCDGAPPAVLHFASSGSGSARTRLQAPLLDLPERRLADFEALGLEHAPKRSTMARLAAVALVGSCSLATTLTPVDARGAA